MAKKRIDLGFGMYTEVDVPDPIDKAISGVSNTVNRELSNAGNSANSALTQATPSLDEFANGLVNYATAGLAGYKDGKFDVKSGYLTRAIDEGLGEVTGRNAGREQMAFQREQVAKEAAAAKEERRNELERRRQDDVAASNYAGAARATARAQTTSQLGYGVGDLQTDFLGL